MKRKMLMRMKKALVLAGVAATMLLAGCGEKKESAQVNVGSLKGPTSMGLVSLMDKNEAGEAGNDYTFTMETAADALLTGMVKGELDIALVPANVASILYQKTEGQVAVIDINTLSVLYMVSADTSLQSFSDLKGRTIYLTGKGTTPDYALQYLLEKNQISLDEVTLEYKSEATEVASVLAQNPQAVGLLPQPFVTAACTQNENLQIVYDFNEEWNAVSEDGSNLVIGVTVVRKEFLEDNKEAVRTFMEEHKASAEFANANLDEAAASVVKYGILEKEPIAKKALPACNITYIDGENMKQSLSGYLNVLYEMEPSSIGNSLPGDDFYYIAQGE
ncbi:MAG: ABC transporter substrate-binding protein [Lachnospiraceae bacterium]|nr:ABC transporter substrate-binding protein [Lachnospiraceae bacterium]